METKAVFVIFSVMLYCSLEAYGQLPGGNLEIAVKPEVCNCKCIAVMGYQ